MRSIHLLILVGVLGCSFAGDDPIRSTTARVLVRSNDALKVLKEHRFAEAVAMEADVAKRPVSYREAQIVFFERAYEC